MNEIVLFLDKFFQTEVKACTADLRPDLEFSGECIRELYSFMSSECINKMGVILPVRQKPDKFYDDYKDEQFEHLRHLYKISQYKHPQIGDLWVAYVSSFITSDFVKDYHEMTYCFFITQIDGAFKIIGQASVNPDDRKRWVIDFGDSRLDLNNLGEFVGTERYLEPKDDEISMEKWSREE